MKVGGSVSSRGGLPSVLCAAKAKSTQEPCRKYAIPGSSVCAMHGGSTRAARQKADLRMSLAQILRDDPRPPWQVLLEALHTSDAIMQDLLQVARDQDLTPEQMDRLVQAAERAAKMS